MAGGLQCCLPRPIEQHSQCVGPVRLQFPIDLRRLLRTVTMGDKTIRFEDASCNVFIEELDLFLTCPMRLVRREFAAVRADERDLAAEDVLREVLL